MSEKPTIFIAHSTLDLSDARAIRNMFEGRDHDVLLFKLAQQMTGDFLNSILHQEIQARDWLVVIATENAERSSWVTVEKHFAQTSGKPIFYIELAPCSRLTGSAREACLADQVARISRAIRVFISYHRDDLDLARRLAEDLKRHGYEVWLDIERLSAGEVWSASISSAIELALEKGAVVALLSKGYLSNRYTVDQLISASRKPGRLIPCAVSRGLVDVPRELARYQMLNLERSYDDGLKQLLASLG